MLFEHVTKRAYVCCSGTSQSNLKRLNCLDFEIKTNLKRHEVIQLLREINFEPQKLVGMAEMRSRGIDITCKTRQDALQPCEKLRQIDFVYIIRLTNLMISMFFWFEYRFFYQKTKSRKR